jgi:WD40 repeat protein
MSVVGVEDHLKQLLGELTLTIDELIKENRQCNQFLYKNIEFFCLVKLQLSEAGVKIIEKSRSGRQERIFKNPFKKERKKTIENLWSPNFIFSGHEDGINEIHMNISNQYIASASADSTLRIYDVSKRDESRGIVLYRGHRGSVNSVRFHGSHGQLFCSASGDGSVHLVKLNVDSFGDVEEEDVEFKEVGISSKKKIVDMLLPETRLSNGHQGPVSFAVWNSAGDSVVSSGWDGNIAIWKVDGRDISMEPRKFKAHDGKITHLDVFGHLTCSSSFDGTSKIWDVRTSTMVTLLQGHSSIVNASVFSKGDTQNMVASSSEDRTILFWDLRNSSKPLKELQFNSAPNRLSYSPSGSFLAIPFDDGSLQVYSTIYQELIGYAQAPNLKLMVSSTCWAQDEHYLFSAGWDRNVYAWNQHFSETPSVPVPAPSSASKA